MKTLKIIKIGGHIIDSPELLTEFLEQYAQLASPKILIHGGGKTASALAENLGIPVKMDQGRRITDEEMLKVTTMVYAGLLNKHIVATLQGAQCNAIGLTGADANCIEAQKRPVTDIDYGFAGDITKVNTQLILSLLEQQLSPVFCAVTHDKNGQLLNTNADTVAAAIASSLSAEFDVMLYYCFEKKGVLKDLHDEGSLLETLCLDDFTSLQQEGIIASGMIPKLHNCFEALTHGVTAVKIGIPAMLFSNIPHTTVQL
jgi:acetylglutamate kinase